MIADALHFIPVDVMMQMAATAPPGGDWGLAPMCTAP
jgi:hypothetical protein